jgi:hypothetical protein
MLANGGFWKTTAFLDYISNYAYKHFTTAATEVWKATSVRRTERISLHVIKTYKAVEVKLPPFLASALVRGKWSVLHPGSFTHLEKSSTQPLHWEDRKVSHTVQNRTPDHPAHSPTTHSRLHTWLASRRTEPRTGLSTHHRPIKRGEVQRQEINQPVAYKMQQRTVKRSFSGKIKLQMEKYR